eukprot:g2594.t1
MSGFQVGCRVRVLRGRQFSDFKERDEGTVVFDGRQEKVQVALKHLRVVGHKNADAGVPPEKTSKVLAKQIAEEMRLTEHPAVQALDVEMQELRKALQNAQTRLKSLEAKDARQADEILQLTRELSTAKQETLQSDLAVARSEAMSQEMLAQLTEKRQELAEEPCKVSLLRKELEQLREEKARAAAQEELNSDAWKAQVECLRAELQAEQAQRELQHELTTAAFLECASRGRCEFMLLLLRASGGLGLTEEDHLGRTALHRSAVEGHTEAVRLLVQPHAVKASAETDALDHQGQTACDLARERQQAVGQALGILGRQQRFALAAEVVNELLKSRLRAQEEALERPGCGDRHYDQQLLQLLSGPASQARLDTWNPLHSGSRTWSQEELRARSVEQRKELQVAQERWKEASADCLKKSCSPVKLLVKRRALQDIVAMAERTDAAREAVFSFGRCPEELLDVLKACWPKDEAQNAQVPHAQVLSLCKQLRDAQVVDRELRRLEGNEGYLTDCAAEHAAELEGWMGDEDTELLNGFAASLAHEARRFLRQRLPVLAAEESKPLMLHTLQQMVRFHSSILTLGGSQAAEALMLDFETNCPLEEAPSHAPTSPTRTPPATGGLLAARLARLAPAAVETALGRSEGPAVGFLDLWASVDAAFVAEKLTEALARSGSAWRVRSVDPTVEQGPEIFTLATLLPDLLERSAERVSCLSTESARCTYCSVVMAPGLCEVAKALKQRWNEMADPLKEMPKVERLLQTLQALCIFLDGFQLARHMVAACDELRQLEVLIKKKLTELQESAEQ